ncbi:hypothetical protein EVJ58_g8873 [Rhodofomes roseus]|uniref:Uncharacterized protein n=1 Tax=Rhodofomes roseus TaxID=34475 RepID=A0A4Y9XWA5_9APHY|nr:hypothetical protein EVJ58_g8873 [Rhodofomes roseus]
MRPLDGAAIVADMVENGGWLLIGAHAGVCFPGVAFAACQNWHADRYSSGDTPRFAAVRGVHRLRTASHTLSRSAVVPVLTRPRRLRDGKPLLLALLRALPARPRDAQLHREPVLRPRLAAAPLPLPGLAAPPAPQPAPRLLRRGHAARDVPPRGPAARPRGARGGCTPRARTGHADAPPLFSAEQFWSLSPEYYVRDLFLEGHYGTLVASTGGHWTTTLLSAFRDEGARGEGIDGVLGFFDAAMRRWAEDVQGILDDYERRGRRWGLGRRRERKQVVVRAYLPGHEDCHNERAPWREWRPFVWNWYNWGSIWEFNRIFEGILDTGEFPDVHYLAIDQPALLRPDAHSAGDCLHIMTGAGVLEGWTHYIWHFVTHEVPAKAR